MKRKGRPSSSSPSASSSSSVLLVEPEERKNWSENPKTRSWGMGVQRRLADADKEQLCRECSWKKPHFFKVLIGAFRERLILPPAFLKQLMVVESGVAVVKDQSNRCWDFELLRRDNGMIFSKGWKQFVVENDLETGDFLVFRYDGGLHFTVTIFDKSSCEKITENRCPIIKAQDAASSFKTTNPSFKIVMTNRRYSMFPYHDHGLAVFSVHLPIERYSPRSTVHLAERKLRWQKMNSSMRADSSSFIPILFFVSFTQPYEKQLVGKARPRSRNMRVQSEA
ncbi:B3 domain-containing protein [Nymphaea thermarum]|nr:B3 domain-containing protein [Nymphaea thermarum]